LRRVAGPFAAVGREYETGLSEQLDRTPQFRTHSLPKRSGGRPLQDQGYPEQVDIYGHLWPDSHERTRTAIDAVFATHP
jgi:hypothetical protein